MSFYIKQRLTISREDMKTVFAPVVRNIMEMITEQERAARRKGAKVTV
jgi:hypothetical protein